MSYGVLVPLWIAACTVWAVPVATERFLLDLAWSLAYIPISMQMVINNQKPEHWEHSSVKGFDQAYRNMSKLVDYENVAFQEAGWKPTTESVSESGPNVTSMVISLVLLTFACFSFLVLIMLM